MEGMRVITIPTGRFDGRSYLLMAKDGQAAVVDPDINLDRIQEAIGRENAAVKYILLTHCHFDHVSSADALREATGAKTVILKEEVPGLFDPFVNLTGRGDQPIIRGRQIDIQAEDGAKIALGDLCIRVLHTPGHTVGGCCYLAGQALFTGDTIFRGTYGNLSFPGGDRAALVASALRLFELDGALRIFPGHGPSSTIAQERVSNPILL